MIGIWSAYASTFLYVVAIGTVTLFGLPLLFWPLRWAKVLRWHIPDQTDLTVYFGRCLGAVICVLGVFAFLSNTSLVLQLFYFKLIMTLFIFMILVHIYGAIRRIQPISETYEILYWILMFVLSVLFYPE